MFKEILSYSGWILNGNLAVMGFTQGLNVLLNLFFGPVVNAARGIAVQVQTACIGFCGSFQTALGPQLTKSYARGELDYMHNLVVKGSKFSFYILFFIVLPLMFEAPVVLKLWLGTVPNYTVNFLRLILCVSLLGTLSNPIIVSVHATGNLKRFQLIEGSMLLLIVPIAYVALKYFYLPPESVFVVHFCMQLATQYVRLRIVLPLIKMDLKDYCNQVIAPLLKVLFLSPILPCIVYFLIEKDVLRFFAVCITCVVSCSFFIYMLGCTKSEKNFVLMKICSVVKIKR